MKTKLFIAIVLLLLFIPMTVAASEAEIRIFVDDTQLNISAGLGKPFIDAQSRTQIPIRAVSEGLGYEVHWDGATKTATIIKADNEHIYVTIGSNEVLTPDGPVMMDTTAVIIEQRTYLPLRFVSEALGYIVNYQQGEDYHKVDINSPITESDYYRPDLETVPEEILNWIEYSKELPLVQEKEFNGQRYVLITEGMKLTGGYSVEVVGVYNNGVNLEIRVQSTEPLDGESVTQAITYPYELIIVEESELPLRFVDMDNEDRYFMGLHGIDEIDKPIVASSDWIKIFTPEPGEQIGDTITLSGLANVFEGTVTYNLISDGEVVLSHYTTGSMGDWGYFEEEIQVPQDMDATELYLELYSESAEDGSKMFTVTVPLTMAD